MKAMYTSNGNIYDLPRDRIIKSERYWRNREIVLINYHIEILSEIAYRICVVLFDNLFVELIEIVCFY